MENQGHQVYKGIVARLVLVDNLEPAVLVVPASLEQADNRVCRGVMVTAVRVEHPDKAVLGDQANLEQVVLVALGVLVSLAQAVLVVLVAIAVHLV